MHTYIHALNNTYVGYMYKYVYTHTHKSTSRPRIHRYNGYMLYYVYTDITYNVCGHRCCKSTSRPRCPLALSSNL